VVGTASCFWPSGIALAGRVIACFALHAARLFCTEMVYLRNVLACLWRDCSGSSLIEYSLLITITIVLVVVGVAFAGRWAASMWTNLVPALPP
jgi:Flp pilus assembly pilin Flp